MFTSFFISFVTVASLQFLALISPGPDFMLVTRNALLYSRPVAIWTGLGISLGLVVHLSYCILGLGWMIEHSKWVFDVFKYMGGGYLIYTGIQSFRPIKGKSLAVQEGGEACVSLTPRAALRQGFVCNLMNPKAGLFFLGLFTFVNREGTPFWQQSLYGIWMVSITAIWFTVLAYFITQSVVQKKIAHWQSLIVRLLGVLLIGIGIILLFAKV